MHCNVAEKTCHWVSFHWHYFYLDLFKEAQNITLLLWRTNLFITRYLLLDITFHEVWLQNCQNIKLSKSFECRYHIRFFTRLCCLLMPLQLATILVSLCLISLSSMTKNLPMSLCVKESKQWKSKCSLYCTTNWSRKTVIIWLTDVIVRALSKR